MHYSCYMWKNGKPYGQEPASNLTGVTYKVVSDPYFKRFSIEKYEDEVFQEIIYDSLLLDFRHLKPEHQLAWEKVLLSIEPSKTVHMIKNQDDRCVLIEECLFEGDLCRKCILKSAHGVHLSTHEMFYRHLGDPFDGVVLFDREGRPVMYKTYLYDTQLQEFIELQEEQWNVQTSDWAMQLAYHL